MKQDHFVLNDLTYLITAPSLPFINEMRKINQIPV